MKDKNCNMDALLQKSLSSSETPDPELVQKIKYEFKEKTMKKSIIRRFFGTTAAAVLASVFITSTAFAAWYFLKPSEVADKFENRALSAAFNSDTAININASVTSGDYIFTLLAIVSGKDITSQPIYILSDRTYSIVAIQKSDGSPMPSMQDDEYGNMPFYVSPYIKGLKPWQVNAHTMNGGHSEMVIDGVMYRIIDCDEITMFADRGIYLGINTGSFYNSDAFIFNEETGELKSNPDYDGTSAVFDLPIDKSLANPEKSQQYLDTLLNTDEVEDIDNVAGGATGLEIYEDSESGIIVRRFTTYEDYQNWMVQKLAETQKKVDKGEYSSASMELDRRDYENKLQEIKNGATLTMTEFEDGSHTELLTYPETGTSTTLR